MTITQAFMTLAQLPQPDIPCPVALTADDEPFPNAMCWVILRITLAELSGQLPHCVDSRDLLCAIDSGQRLHAGSGVIDDVEVYQQCVQVMQVLAEEKARRKRHHQYMAHFDPSWN